MNDVNALISNNYTSVVPKYNYLDLIDSTNSIIKRNVISEHFESKRKKVFRQMVEQSGIGIHVKEDALIRILKDGRIKSVFETDDVEYVRKTRTCVERNVMHVPNETPDCDRPIYGQLTKDISVFTPKGLYYFITRGHWNWYGPILIVIDKEKVLPYTTITMGDSYNVASESASKLSDPVFRGTDSINLIKDYKKCRLSEEHIEVQIHGMENHTLDVIKEIIFTEVPTEITISLLIQRNIKFRIITEEDIKDKQRVYTR